MRNALPGLVALLLVLLGFVLLLNRFRTVSLPLRYESKEARLQHSIANSSPAPTPHMTALRVLSLDEFKMFVQEKRGPVLDARAEVYYRLGHVPGALSLQIQFFEQGYAKVKERLEPFLEKPIAVYCGGKECEDSRFVAEALVKLGFKQVSIFSGGWEEWTRASMPVEKGM